MGRRVSGLVVCALILAHLSSAVCQAADSPALKVGYVSLAKVFDGYERTKSLDAALEQKGKQKETELEGRMEDLKKMRQNLELLNDAAREAKAHEIEAKSDELQQFKTATARDLRRERDKLTKDILGDIQKTIEEYGKANGFSFIVEERSLVYGQSAYDVTDAVLKLLNSRDAKKP